ncbi:MAG: hypothetical protein ACOYJF_09020 [Prevotella sp.]|jgi:predicted transcriptional regulator
MKTGTVTSGKQSVSFRWDPELVRRLKEIAKKQNRSFSNFTETLLSRAINIIDNANEDVPNETTLAAMKEAKDYQQKVKAGLMDDDYIDTSSVEAMIKSTLR